MSARQRLLDHLKNDIYCRLGVSEISGVGVFAIKTVPAGVDPFRNLSKEKEKIIHLEDSDLVGVDKETKKILGDFFGGDGYDVLASGPNYLNISFYLNHSDSPNVDIVDPKGSGYMAFRTRRQIKKGEELTIDYNSYN
jgi:SET domain-containing protein